MEPRKRAAIVLGGLSGVALVLGIVALVNYDQTYESTLGQLAQALSAKEHRDAVISELRVVGLFVAAIALAAGAVWVMFSTPRQTAVHPQRNPQWFVPPAGPRQWPSSEWEKGPPPPRS
jgi:hypothetical protein